MTTGLISRMKAAGSNRDERTTRLKKTGFDGSNGVWVKDVLGSAGRLAHLYTLLPGSGLENEVEPMACWVQMNQPRHA